MTHDPDVEWWHVHAWFAVVQAIIGAPLWYQVYVVGEPVAALSLRLVAAFGGLPSVALAAMLLTMLISILGAPTAAALGYLSIEECGGDAGIEFLLLAVVGIQFWPLQLLAVALHRKDTTARPAPERAWFLEEE